MKIANLKISHDNKTADNAAIIQELKYNLDNILCTDTIVDSVDQEHTVHDSILNTGILNNSISDVSISDFGVTDTSMSDSITDEDAVADILIINV